MHLGVDAFISYSHAADSRLAPALERGLERLARPWSRLRAVSVFRDQTDLSLTPHLWPTIAAALDEARWLVLLCSPQAAASQYVGREVAHFCDRAGTARVLLVLTDGELAWDAAAGDFAAASTALPPALRGRFADEPLWLDLRWARDVDDLSLRLSRFRAAVAQVASAIRGVPPDELEGEDIRLHRRARRLARAAVAALAVLAVTAATAAGVAVVQRDRAQEQARRAVGRQVGLAALDVPAARLDEAFLMTLAAADLDPAGTARFDPARVLVGRNAALDALLYLPSGAANDATTSDAGNGSGGAVAPASVRAVAVPPDGSARLVAAAYRPDGGTDVVTWPASGPPRAVRVGPGPDPTGLAVLAGGTVVLGARGGPAVLVAPDRAVRPLADRLLALDPAGQRALVADADGRVGVLDLVGGVARPAGPSLDAAPGATVRAGALVPGRGDLVLVTDGRLERWRVLAAATVRRDVVPVPASIGTPRAVVASGDGRHALVAGSEGVAFVDLAGAQPPVVDTGGASGPDGPAGAAAGVLVADPSGRWAALGGRTLVVRDLSSGARTLTVPLPVTAAAWSGACADAATRRCRLVTAGESLDVWEPATGLRRPLTDQSNAQSVAVSTDGARVATAGWGSTAALWTLDRPGAAGRPAPATAVTVPTGAGDCAGELVARSPDGRLLAAYRRSDALTVLCRTAGGPALARARLAGATVPATALAVDDDGSIVLGGNGIVERYPATTGTTSGTSAGPSTAASTGAPGAAVPSGWRAGTGVDVRFGADVVVRSLAARDGRVAAGLSSSGTAAATGGTARVLLWPAAAAGTPVQFDLDRADVPAVALLGPDGGLVAVAGRDAPSGPVTVTVWESDTRRRVGRGFAGLVGDVVALSGDRTRVTGADAAGHVVRWDLDADPAREVCAIVGRAITHQEWDAVAGGALRPYPFRPLCPVG